MNSALPCSHSVKFLWFYKAILLALVLFASTVVIAGQSKVLIVSTDSTVYRHQEIAKEFKAILKQYNYQWIEYDLGGQSDTDYKLKLLIQQEKPNTIYCIGTKAYALAHSYAPDTKLLFSAAINWRRLGITKQSYGVSNELSPSQEISLVRYFFPTIKKIGLLYNKKYSLEYIDTIKQDTASLGVQIIDRQIDNAQEIESALTELLPKVDLFWLISDPVVLTGKESMQQIFQSAKQQNKPVYAYSDIFIQYGALLSVSADMGTIGRQSANLLVMMDADKVPEGTVQIPAGSSVTLNKCVLDALKLNFNRDAMSSINNIVECGQ